MDTVPVIDIAPFLGGAAKGQAAVAAAVDQMPASSLGFLIIEGHGVPDSLIDDMRKTSFAYFDRPLEEKLKLRMPAGPLSRLYFARQRGAVLFAGRRIAAGLQRVVFDRPGRSSR